jgi:hypothetical protein
MWYHLGPNHKIIEKYVECVKAEAEVTEATMGKPLEATFAAPKLNAELSRCMAEAANRSYTYARIIDFSSLTVQAEPRVWIYNASRMEHSVDHPVLGTVRIPANTTSKRYALYTSLPHTLAVPKFDIDARTTYGTPMSGARLAMDLINPDNLGLDQNEVFKFSTGVGRNLGEKGVFWSLNNPPHRGEVTEVVKRMEKRYKMLLEKVAVGLAGGVNPFEDLVKDNEKSLRANYAKRHAPKDRPSLSYIKSEARRMAQETYSITPEHHAAAEHFRVTTEWHPVLGGTR